eukprot:5016702-Pleurochrysis_carterae.AAC.3
MQIRKVLVEHVCMSMLHCGVHLRVGFEGGLPEPEGEGLAQLHFVQVQRVVPRVARRTETVVGRADELVDGARERKLDVREADARDVRPRTFLHVTPTGR